VKPAAWGCAALVALAGLGGRLARADGGERPVVLFVADCRPGVDIEIRRIVGLELGDLLARSGGASSSDRLDVTCADASARLQASGPDRPSPVDRMLRLADFPADAVPRALALAGLEMLAALSPAVRRRVDASADSTKEIPPAPVLPSVRPADWRADVSLLWQGFLGDQGLSLWGGRASVGRRLGSSLNLSLDLEAARGARTVSLGRADATSGGAGAFLGIPAGTREVFAEIALGGRVGLVQLSGEPSQANVIGEQVLRVWGGPALSFRLWAGHGRVALVFCGESGLAILGADGVAGDVIAVRARGFWVSLALGMGIRL
jgi:hypothetical protein